MKGKTKQTSEVQLVLVKDALRLKISFYKGLLNSCLVIVIVYAKSVKKGIINKNNCCCLHQIVNSSDTQNCANNREFQIKLDKNLCLSDLQSTRSYFKRF